jgi:hypothetical protein
MILCLPFAYWVGFTHISRQLPDNVLVEDFLYGQGDDDFMAALHFFRGSLFAAGATL